MTERFAWLVWLSLAAGNMEPYSLSPITLHPSKAEPPEITFPREGTATFNANFVCCLDLIRVVDDGDVSVAVALCGRRLLCCVSVLIFL